MYLFIIGNLLFTSLLCYSYLVDQETKEKEREKSIRRYQDNSQKSGPNNIAWIEKLLQTPIEDYRKNAVSLILAPYLITVRKMSVIDAFSAIKEWLDKCALLKALDSNFNYRVKYALIVSRYDSLKYYRGERVINKGRYCTVLILGKY